MVIRALGALCLLLAGLAAPVAAAPKRVVSINLCTDQLAMQLAAPGQLISISFLASDPHSSTMAEAAKAYPLNHGRAEEIYLLHPDLVLSGRFTDRATIDMLERLGIPVVGFAPAYGLEDVRQGMIRMGQALGRETAAAEMLAAFDVRLATLRADPPWRPIATTYEANGYSSGTESLSSEILQAAGFDPLAKRLGRARDGRLPLELLVMEDPDLVVTGRAYPGQSRSEEILRHPALATLNGGQIALEDHNWLCGLPAVLDAVETLDTARTALEAQR